MKKKSFFLYLLIFPIMGGAIENGIYLISDKKTDLVVKTIYLGKKISYEILRADFYATDNSNENYYLSILRLNYVKIC